MIVRMKLAQSKEVQERLEEAGFDLLPYDSHWQQYRVRVGADADEKQRAVLLAVMKQAREGFGKQPAWLDR